MSREAIVERILSDAEAEKSAILADARARADAIVAEANLRAEKLMEETKSEVQERARRIAEGRAASARLDSAKILLSEKRRVIDEIYGRALDALLSLGERESLKLYERLLRENAEAGEEVVFASCFPYAEAAAKLSVVSELGLRISPERANIDGGFLLKGERCDKDLSFSALLSLDREERQSELAEKLFR